MDTPAAAPDRPRSSLESDIAPYAASSIPWIIFGGSQNESSTAFVQSIHRVGFQQGRGRDDGWIAEYAATCFEGDALIWYTELDDEIQESWKKLRASLLRKYPHVAGVGAPPLFSIPQHAINPPALRPIGLGAPSAGPSHPQGLIGRIEILADYTVLRGYISFDPTSGIDITTDKGKALVISLPQTNSKDVLQLDMLSVPNRAFPYLGLALLSPQGNDPNVVPNALPGVSSSQPYYGSPPTSYSGIPEPSSSCKYAAPSNPNGATVTVAKVPFATWRFCASSKSKTPALSRRRSLVEAAGTRAAAAVWKYNRNTEELTMYWLLDDDTECEVGGYMHKDTSDQLHVHRISDMDMTGGYILEERVRFVFGRSQ
ncbi:hypothetical protein FS837_004767 [Tulasnella sp. UAMH 9824]|nr:hypothetical protein FS837_004767 [Tulasnella sp. UAMH 9824]